MQREGKIEGSDVARADDGTSGGPLPAQNGWRVAAGDPKWVFFAGIAQPINCGSRKRARLIAATPDLLEALKALRADVECYCLDRREAAARGVCGACMADAALAKASTPSRPSPPA